MSNELQDRTQLIVHKGDNSSLEGKNNTNHLYADDIQRVVRMNSPTQSILFMKMNKEGTER